MRRFTLAVALVSAALALGGLSATACGTDYATATASDAGADGESAETTTTVTPAANGAPCGTGSACASAQCVDGVCCESACTGTCESCKLPGTVGTCSPIPDGTDPDSECPTAPLADAGAPDASTAPDASDDVSDAGDAGDAAVNASVVVFTIPDGGLPATSASQCAGHCNGKRACAYAGNETTCGAAFCGDTAEQGVATCDGAGHCLYGVEECSAYACPNGSPGCKTSCAATSDCLATFYCDGATQICKPKLANGTACTNVTQCESGVCDSTAGVCCNIDCASTPGGTCAKAGAVGTCTCGACSGAGGCALFYVDRDGDSYGDMNGTIANGGAAYGCALAADGPPPTGFVADHTDCFDSTVAIANSVHPGQTVFFASAYTNGSGQSSFDYDCSGSTESETVDNAKCGVCSGLRIVTPGGPATTPVLECIFQTTCSSAAEATGHSCSPSPAACTANNNPAYPGTVACGASAESYTCSTCGDAGATSTLSIDAGMRTQRCH